MLLFSGILTPQDLATPIALNSNFLSLQLYIFATSFSQSFKRHFLSPSKPVELVNLQKFRGGKMGQNERHTVGYFPFYWDPYF